MPGGPFSVFIGVDGDTGLLGGVDNDLADDFKTFFRTLGPWSDRKDGVGEAVACREGLGVVGGVDIEYCCGARSLPPGATAIPVDEEGPAAPCAALCTAAEDDEDDDCCAAR
jgi:hypothetical protein